MNMNHIIRNEAASLSTSMKRDNTEYEDDGRVAKRQRTCAMAQSPETEQSLTKGWTCEEFKPSPFLYYTDYSMHPDPDSCVPLTLPGRVPNFPAKMHAILSRQELADVVCWMPHGRSWKVLKPREFEVRVLPTYFEHAKFSSLIRQANAWGFRRITSGRDRNSYYHPLFLRGLPHLCKQMKRHSVAQKASSDQNLAPDLYMISDMYPVPLKAHDDSIMLRSTIKGGPRARMSIESILPHLNCTHGDSIEPEALVHGVQDESMGSADVEMMSLSESTVMPHAISRIPQPEYHYSSTNRALVTSNQMAFALSTPTTFANHSMFDPSFVAGFAAAVAVNQQRFNSIMAPQQSHWFNVDKKDS